MKYCPTCQLKYADETFEFCLQDGTSLVEVTSETPTVILNETETVVRNNLQDLRQSEIKSDSGLPTAPQKSNTGLAILLTAFGMFLLFGLGMWLYSGSQQPEVTQNKNSSPLTTLSTSPSVADKSYPVNGNSTNPSKTTSTPASDFNPDEIKTAISDAIYAWKSLAESRDLNSYMNNYADTVDYYNKRAASRSFVRNDKQKYFTMYDSLTSTFSNMRITPGATGETATAVFDKEWVNQGPNKYSEGKVQSQLQFVKVDGRWRIGGEKDLKVY